jgi:hypothetical protein
MVSEIPNSKIHKDLIIYQAAKKSFFAGCSKRSRCKAPKILRSEAVLACTP